MIKKIFGHFLAELLDSGYENYEVKIDGIEIKISTSINKKSGNPQFNGVSFNNTKNNIQISLQNLIDGTYIVIEKYNNKKMN